MNVTGVENGPIRVLVVDDHPLLREGIAAVIQGETDVVTVAEASTDGRRSSAFGNTAQT